MHCRMQTGQKMLQYPVTHENNEDSENGSDWFIVHRLQLNEIETGN